MSKTLRHKAEPVPSDELEAPRKSTFETLIEGRRQRNPRLRAREELIARRKALAKELGK